MLGKKMSLKKLAKKVKVMAVARSQDPTDREDLLGGFESSSSPPPPVTPTRGFIPMYVGVWRQPFLVRTEYLSHPLFNMLLEKDLEDYRLEHISPEQATRFLVPCSVSAFQEIVKAVENRTGKFEFGNLLQELV